jgi:hypothetical protein
MRGSAAIATRRQVTPRFYFEIAAAAFLTLCAVVFAGHALKSAPLPAGKSSLQAAPAPVQQVANEDASVAEFMENFALSRLAPRLPDNLDARSASAEPVAKSRAGEGGIRIEQPAAKEKPRSVAFRQQPAPQPPRRAAERPQMAQAETPAPEVSAKQASKRIPVISFIAEKLPSGRDIGEAMASVGKRVTSIFRPG